MPKPRKQIISLEITPYYHCISRCVRRAFLCGFDRTTGKSYEHRREWVEQRILFLGQVFAIDVCAYAVMNNHHHTVLRINQAQVQAWSDMEVCSRWHKIYKGTLLTQKYLRNAHLSNAELLAVQGTLSKWRAQLCSISWFMRALNEPIARMANAEDDCTGSFFESRFKSQALLDEKALIACMAYVDLNPVRAKIAKTAERSPFTSIHTRISAHKQHKQQPQELAHFYDKLNSRAPNTLPFCLSEYFELVDWTAKVFRTDSSVNAFSNPPNILLNLGISSRQWQFLSSKFGQRFLYFAGHVQSLKRITSYLGYKRTPGYTRCKVAFG